MMMTVVAAGDHHEEGGREIAEVTTMIDRKEAAKDNAPPWPKITKLDGWKMALTMNVTSASAHPDIEVWVSWLACAFVVNPDLDFLADSGAGGRLAMMDI